MIKTLIGIIAVGAVFVSVQANDPAKSINAARSIIDQAHTLYNKDRASTMTRCLTEHKQPYCTKYVNKTFGGNWLYISTQLRYIAYVKCGKYKSHKDIRSCVISVMKTKIPKKVTNGWDFDTVFK